MKQQSKKIAELFSAMTPIDGEVRTVCRCRLCDNLFGHQYIPGGLGRGMIIDPCMCMTTNNQHGQFATVDTLKP